MPPHVSVQEAAGVHGRVAPAVSVAVYAGQLAEHRGHADVVAATPRDRAQNVIVIGPVFCNVCVRGGNVGERIVTQYIVAEQEITYTAE